MLLQGARGASPGQLTPEPGMCMAVHAITFAVRKPTHVSEAIANERVQACSKKGVHLQTLDSSGSLVVDQVLLHQLLPSERSLCLQQKPAAPEPCPAPPERAQTHAHCPVPCSPHPWSPTDMELYCQAEMERLQLSE